MTRYYLKIRFRNTGQVKVVTFETPTERVMAKISWGQYADIIEEWDEECEA